MKKLLIILFLTFLVTRCDSSEPKTMNQPSRSLDELKILAIDSGDIDAYNELEIAYLDYEHGAFFEIAKKMADIHNFPQAYYDTYIQLLEPTDNPKATINLDSSDNETKHLALLYLKKSSALGFEPATEELLLYNQSIPEAKTINKLIAFKRIVMEELDSHNDSLTINESNEILKIQYLNSSFDINKIDSIEFYGRNIRNQQIERMIPMGTSVIIYSNNDSFYDMAFDSLRSDNRTIMRNLHKMLKPGGIVFRTNRALIIYSINTCGPGYKNLLRIDGEIKKHVFNSSSFYRLHNGCGSQRMKEIEE